MRLRPVDPAHDLSALDALFDQVTEVDGHRPIGEHKYLDLIGPIGSSPHGIVAEVEGAIVGYVAIGQNTGSAACSMELALHPCHRESATMRAMIRAGIDAATSVCGPTVRMWAFQTTLASVLADLGFEAERELRQLRISLPHSDQPRFDPDVEIEAYRPGLDDARWLAVNNAAFAGHPENGSWTLGLLADRKSQPWFDPSGIIMAWIGGALAGFCWTKQHSAELGEIYIIAVDPDHRGMGLGRSLVLAGLDSMAGRGMETAMLYVDAGNTGALALYGALGFELDHVDRSFIRTV